MLKLINQTIVYKKIVALVTQFLTILATLSLKKIFLYYHKKMIQNTKI